MIPFRELKIKPNVRMTEEANAKKLSLIIKLPERRGKK